MFTQVENRPSNRPLFLDAITAMVFLVNTIHLYFICVHINLMNFVEPIRNRKKIAQIKNILRGQNRFRDLLLFVVGINTALRISDLLQLRIGDFLDDKGLIKRRFWIKEKKHGKRHEIVINKSIREILWEQWCSHEGIYTCIWCLLHII